MTIQQTVDIPASHRLTIEVPREVPAGPVILTFTPKAAEPELKEGKRARGFGCLKGQIWMADDFDAPLDDFKEGKRAQGFGCLKGKGEFWMADDFDAPLDDFKNYM
jgi:hypothetical protein